MKLDIDTPTARLRLGLLHLTNLIVLLAQYERAHPSRKAALADRLASERELLIRLLEEAF